MGQIQGQGKTEGWRKQGKEKQAPGRREYNQGEERCGRRAARKRRRKKRCASFRERQGLALDRWIRWSCLRAAGGRAPLTATPSDCGLHAHAAARTGRNGTLQCTACATRVVGIGEAVMALSTALRTVVKKASVLERTSNMKLMKQ